MDHLAAIAHAIRSRTRGSKDSPPKDPDQDAHGRVIPSLACTTFHSWAEVGDWYRGLASARAEPNDALRAKTHSLTREAKTPDEQVRALYRFVSEIRDVGINLGVGRFQPHRRPIGSARRGATACILRLGLHLAQMEEWEGDVKEALKVYQMAKAFHEEPREEPVLTKIQAGIDRLHGSDNSKATQLLQESRTFWIKPAEAIVG